MFFRQECIFMIMKKLVTFLLIVFIQAYAADQFEQKNCQLFCALQDGAPFVDIRRLIDEGADVKAIEAYPERANALHYIAGGDSVVDSSFVLYLIQEHSIDVNGKDCAGSTPCHYAAAYNRGSLIEILFQKGGSVNLKNLQGETPLHFACKNGAFNAVKALLKSGANPKALNSWGVPAVDFAKMCDFKELVEYIEGWEALPEIKEPDLIN